MRWKIVLEGTDEFGSRHRSELTIDKDLERVSAGEIGFSVEDGKTIMAHLQQVVVNQQCEAYVLTSCFCMNCERFRRIKGYGKRKIRTVFGCVAVRIPRIMNCQRCLPHFCDARTVLRDICPDQATPELMERSAPRQPLAVSQSGGGDRRVPADPINRVLCDPATPHDETGTAPRRELMNAAGSSRLRRLNAARWSWTCRMTQNVNSS
jgi:hypothetical protein